jgi:hypothetical protein
VAPTASKRETATPIPASAEPSAAVVPQPPGRIAFDRFDGAFGAEAPYLGSFIVEPDGSDPRRLEVPIETIALEPVWSRSGARLLLSTWPPPQGPERPAVIDADGTGFVRFELPDVDGDMLCSGWAPDDALLACKITGYTPDLDGIYTLRPDGTGLTRVTTSPFHFTSGSAGDCGGGEGRGTFSPDGSRIAFIRQRCGTGANPSADESASLAVVNVDGSGLEEIVPQGGVKSHPGSRISWSTDGAWIAFGSQTGDLFVVQPDGSGLRRVPIPAGVGQHHAYGPAWAPDGTRIVFSMYVDGQGSTDLYSIAPDGSGLFQVTDEDGAEAFATWGDPGR